MKGNDSPACPICEPVCECLFFLAPESADVSHTLLRGDSEWEVFYQMQYNHLSSERPKSSLTCTGVTHIDFTEDASAVKLAMLAHYSVFMLLISHEGTERGTLGFRGSNTDHEQHCLTFHHQRLTFVFHLVHWMHSHYPHWWWISVLQNKSWA